MRNPYPILIFLILLTVTDSVWAQQMGHIRGVVVDKATKQPLIGANVQVVGTNLGGSTDAEGVFVIKNLPENVYKVKASYIGYLSYLETDVRVIRKKTTSIKEIGLAPTILKGAKVILTLGMEEEIENLPVSSMTYRREEIRRAAGTAGDVLRAVGSLPGVGTTAGEFATFSVRGGGPRDNLILVDNIPFDKISHWDGGSPEQEAEGGRYSVFTAGLIEEATFSAGGFGPQYGRKNASVLDMTIKEGNIETPTLDGSLGILGWEVNYDGPTKIHDKTSIVLNVRKIDVTRALELAGEEEFGDAALADVIFKTTTFVNSKNKVSVLGILSEDRMSRDRKNLFAADDLVQNDVWTIEETRQILGLNWRLLTGKRSMLHNTVYFRGNERHRSTGNAWSTLGTEIPSSKDEISVRLDIIEQYQNENEIGWKSDFTQMLGKKASINAGVELFSIDLDYQTVQNGLDTLYGFDSRDPRPDPSLHYIVTTPEMTANHFDDRTQQIGAYFSTSFMIGEKFSLSPGVRYEINGFNDQNTFSPRLQVKYHLNPRTVFNAAAGLYYQNPLYSDITSSLENTSLKNEQALHAIVGVSRQLGDDFKVTVEGYYKKFDDLVVRANRSSFAMNNQGEGWTSGIDMLLLKRFTENYYGQLTYSFSVSKRDDNDGLGEYNAPYSQPHIFNILGGYQVNKKFFISAKWTYATGRPKHKFIVHENIFDDPTYIRYSQEFTDRYGDRLTPFHMLDVRLEYRHRIGPITLVTYLDLGNLYNRFNATEDRFSELSGEVKSLGFGFVPSFGLKAEF